MDYLNYVSFNVNVPAFLGGAAAGYPIKWVDQGMAKVGNLTLGALQEFSMFRKLLTKPSLTQTTVHVLSKLLDYGVHASLFALTAYGIKTYQPVEMETPIARDFFIGALATQGLHLYHKIRQDLTSKKPNHVQKVEIFRDHTDLATLEGIQSKGFTPIVGGTVVAVAAAALFGFGLTFSFMLGAAITFAAAYLSIDNPVDEEGQPTLTPSEVSSLAGVNLLGGAALGNQYARDIFLSIREQLLQIIEAK